MTWSRDISDVQGCEKMKHTVPQIIADLDKSKFSGSPAELIQMFEDHEDIIINSNEVNTDIVMTYLGMAVTLWKTKCKK